MKKMEKDKENIAMTGDLSTSLELNEGLRKSTELQHV